MAGLAQTKFSHVLETCLQKLREPWQITARLFRELQVALKDTDPEQEATQLVAWASNNPPFQEGCRKDQWKVSVVPTELESPGTRVSVLVQHVSSCTSLFESMWLAVSKSIPAHSEGSERRWKFCETSFEVVRDQSCLLQNRYLYSPGLRSLSLLRVKYRVCLFNPKQFLFS